MLIEVAVLICPPCEACWCAASDGWWQKMLVWSPDCMKIVLRLYIWLGKFWCYIFILVLSTFLSELRATWKRVSYINARFGKIYKHVSSKEGLLINYGEFIRARFCYEILHPHDIYYNWRLNTRKEIHYIYWEPLI